MPFPIGGPSEQILNGTSAQGYKVPFTSVYAGKYGWMVRV